MKILIDENLPLKVKEAFGDDHEVFAARELDWHGKKNGELLDLMTLAGFEALVTMDKSLPNQQNLEKFGLTFFILRGVNNKLETILDLIPLVLEKIEGELEPGVIEIRLD